MIAPRIDYGTRYSGTPFVYRVVHRAWLPFKTLLRVLITAFVAHLALPPIRYRDILLYRAVKVRHRRLDDGSVRRLHLDHVSGSKSRVRAEPGILHHLASFLQAASLREHGTS